MNAILPLLGALAAEALHKMSLLPSASRTQPLIRGRHTSKLKVSLSPDSLGSETLAVFRRIQEAIDHDAVVTIRIIHCLNPA